MATETSVLERNEQAPEEADSADKSERPHLYKRFAGFGAFISFPVPPDKVPAHWFE